MKKRMICILLTAVMILSLLPGQVFALRGGDGTEANPWEIGATNPSDVTAYIKDGELIIEGTGAMEDFILTGSSLSVPWYDTKSSIEKIVIGEGITYIGNYAFVYCEKVTAVTVPSTLTAIGAYAFISCIKLGSITLPNGLKCIGDNAFRNCLELDSITLPSGLESIGSDAFRSVALTEIVVPDSVTSIGANAFAESNKLSKVTLPKNLTSISAGMFKYCDALTSITIPETVTDIGDHAFYETGLKSITIPEKVKRIDEYAFTRTPMTEVVIPGTVELVRSFAFLECEDLADVTISEGVKELQTCVFDSCVSLTSVKLPTSLRDLGNDVFRNCYGLTTLFLPCANIGSDAYDLCSGCDALEKVFLISNTGAKEKSAFTTAYNRVTYSEEPDVYCVSYQIDSSISGGTLAVDVSAAGTGLNGEVIPVPDEGAVFKSLSADKDGTPVDPVSGTTYALYPVSYDSLGNSDTLPVVTFKVKYDMPAYPYVYFENMKPQTGSCDTYTKVKNGATVWNSGWYVVSGSTPIDIEDPIVVTGEVHLILCDGAVLNAKKGIRVNAPDSLTIYGQANGTGKLVAEGYYEEYAGIGGYGAKSGTITINGGDITATGGANSAGIGGSSGNAAGAIMINGGKITAVGGSYGAPGIGGGAGGAGEEITINGGDIIATGGYDGAGIGGGTYSERSYITINGGSVEATGGVCGAGIGGGCQSAADVTINGGTVTAQGGEYAAGIGAGNCSSDVNIIINGGEITAAGGLDSAGIGGAEYGEDSGSIIISGGTVTAVGGENEDGDEISGAGIGGGFCGKIGEVTILGGTVTASGYTGIGKAKDGVDHGALIIGTDMMVKAGANAAGAVSVLDYPVSREPYVTLSKDTFAALNSALNGSGVNGEEFTVSTGTDGVITITLKKDIINQNPNSTYLLVPEGKTVILDLNGHKIDRALTSAVDKGYVFSINGKLTIKDSSEGETGMITGGWSTKRAGGIYNYGELLIEGGSVSGNKISGNPGVQVAAAGVHNYGKMIMTGGNITGNISEGDTSFAGAIQNEESGIMYLTAAEGKEINITGNTAENAEAVTNWGEMHLSGKVIIKDNIAKGKYGDENEFDSPANLALNTPVIIDGPLTGSEIYVTHIADNDQHNKGVLTEGYSTKNTGAKAEDFFCYDGPDSFRMVLNASGELEVLEECAIENETPETDKNTNNGYLTAAESAFPGDTVTVTVVPNQGYRISKLTWSNGNGTTEIPEKDGVWSFTMPEGDISVEAVFEAIPTYTVTYKVINGTWADGTTADKTETVYLNEKPANVPTGMIANAHYENGAWNADPAASAVTAAVTYTYTFKEIASYTVTYKVINGTWADGTTADKTETVYLNEKPANVPTGMIANAHYENGAWNADPAASAVTAAVTYTYTFEAASNPEYKIIEGADSEWIKESQNGLLIVSDAPFAKFDCVKIDGNVIDAANYLAEEGSTEITLAPAYLEGLSAGKHTIEIVSKDGSASALFTVSAPAPVNVTVTFDLGGHGTEIQAQILVKGEKASRPADPTADGWTFKGWFADKEGKIAFDFSVGITADTTVYASWEEDNDNPETGAENTAPVWFMILILSSSALIGCALYSRKKREED